MTINIDSADFPPPLLLLHLSDQTIASIKQAQSPIKQTFFLSPTPSEESLRTDSPVLPDFPRQDDALTSLSPRPNKPKSPVLTSSSNQNTVNKLAMTPQSDTWITDILPDDMDLYVESSRPPTRRGNTAASYLQHPSSSSSSIVEQDIVLGPEVKRQLPIIRDHDFPYYPLPSYFPPPSSHSTTTQGRLRSDWGEERVQVQRRGTRGLGLKKFLRCAFRRYGVRRV